MDVPVPTSEASVVSNKKRVPKACGSCRQSKVKCDGKRPCTRCDSLKKVCVFVERPKDPTEEKIENLEREVRMLKHQLDDPQSLQLSNRDNLAQIPPHQIAEQHFLPGRSQSSMSTYLTDHTTSSGSALIGAPNSMSTIRSRLEGVDDTIIQSSPTNSSTNNSTTKKRKRTRPEFLVKRTIDFVSNGLITIEQAREYFITFFNGCDRFVPVFDPEHDTFESIRSRSALLFNTICTVGCRILNGAQNARSLSFELQKHLGVLIVSRGEQILESVQALLVTACYSSERSLILSFATRMAFDLGLPDAYEELPRRLRVNDLRNSRNGCDGVQEAVLMRRTRTWLFLLVLENGFRIDAGRIPVFTSRAGARRCRVLLDKPFSAVLDLRLFPQVELHLMRVEVHAKLDEYSGEAEEVDLIELVNDSRVDLDIWYRDWEGITKQSPLAGVETAVLLRNLQVQRYWVESMIYFKAVQLMGVQNVAEMSSSGRDLLAMAKEALRNHLEMALKVPEEYLAHFKYASDFVWAKFAFCFLLLLKLDRLLPESGESSQRLLQHGNKLMAELLKVGTGPGSSTSKFALQVLGLSIEKYDRVLREDQGRVDNFGPEGTTTFSWESNDAQAELQLFVPEQFVFEWDFPGLTLFSSVPWPNPFADDFLLGMTMYDLPIDTYLPG